MVLFYIYLNKVTVIISQWEITHWHQWLQYYYSSLWRRKKESYFIKHFIKTQKVMLIVEITHCLRIRLHFGLYFSINAFYLKKYHLNCIRWFQCHLQVWQKYWENFLLELFYQFFLWWHKTKIYKNKIGEKISTYVDVLLYKLCK